jgi:cytoskeletal protein RodZ
LRRAARCCYDRAACGRAAGEGHFGGFQQFQEVERVVQTVGERLRQRREAKGLSLEAVTRATRLTRTVLSALEEDRYEDIAAPVYVRGFLRIYAQFLEVDADQVLQAWDQQTTVRDEALATPAAPAAALPEYFKSSTRPSRSLTPAQLFLLVATAAIVVVFMWSVNRKRPVQIAARPEVQTAPATATGPAAPTSPLQRGEARR